MWFINLVLSLFFSAVQRTVPRKLAQVDESAQLIAMGKLLAEANRKLSHQQLQQGATLDDPLPPHMDLTDIFAELPDGDPRGYSARERALNDGYKERT